MRVTLLLSIFMMLIAVGVSADANSASAQANRASDPPPWILPAAIASGIAPVVAIGLVLVPGPSRRRRGAMLRLSRLQRMTPFDCSQDAAGIFTIDGRSLGSFVDVNDKACRRLGYDRAELLDMSPVDLLEDVNASRVGTFVDTLRKSRCARSFTAIRSSSGVVVPVEIISGFYRVGNREYVVAVGRRDRRHRATDARLRESVREKEQLIGEIQHRVKNNLQTIAGLVNSQRLIAEDPAVKTALSGTVNRVHAMGLLHKLLYQNGDYYLIPVGRYAQALSDHLAGSILNGSGNIDVRVEPTPLEVDMDTAVPLGLFLNEAISNAMRHGFRERGSGTIRVRIDSDAGELRRAVITDDGIGVPDLESRKESGLGFRMMQMLAQQLRGSCTIGGERGTRVCLALEPDGAGAQPLDVPAPTVGAGRNRGGVT